ncbi:MAG: hypothetical protein IJ040_05245 [Lachnospiraceae bacterium]|nr:hypothetical protein [Lachnospiraceae bacterium]
MKTKRTSILYTILICLPFLLGFIGNSISGHGLLDSLYAAVCIYVMELQIPPENALAEIARWTAPLMTASGVFIAFQKIRRLLSNRIRGNNPNSVAIYGDSAYISTLIDKLGKLGIQGGMDDLSDGIDKAGRYVILYKDEQEGLAFYEQHKKNFQQGKVYLGLETITPQSLQDSNLSIFNLKENIARMYWNQYDIADAFASGNLNLKIGIIGFDTLGQNILTYGLLNNIYSPNQHIEYHIWGNSDEYQHTHMQLQELSPDQVIFHDDIWSKDLTIINDLDRLILCDESKHNLEYLSKLLTYSTCQTIHIHDYLDQTLQSLFNREGVVFFGSAEDIVNIDQIFQESMLADAKAFNHYYAKKYQNCPDTEEAKEEAFRILDGFTRYSNIASADYQKIREKMIGILKEDGETVADTVMRNKDLLSELEHIRWCRYHYLNNWKYGVPSDGKAKDARYKIHSNLVPFEELSEEDQSKDLAAICTMFGIEEEVEL